MRGKYPLNVASGIKAREDHESGKSKPSDGILIPDIEPKESEGDGNKGTGPGLPETGAIEVNDSYSGDEF
jgi:hypothetical protein